jgi:hypothetical protein
MPQWWQIVRVEDHPTAAPPVLHITLAVVPSNISGSGGLPYTFTLDGPGRVRMLQYLAQEAARVGPRASHNPGAANESACAMGAAHTHRDERINAATQDLGLGAPPHCSGPRWRGVLGDALAACPADITGLRGMQRGLAARKLSPVACGALAKDCAANTGKTPRSLQVAPRAPDVLGVVLRPARSLTPVLGRMYAPIPLPTGRTHVPRVSRR